MNAAPVVEVYLNTGQFHFGGDRTRIHTLLGTCIAITLWHPRLLIGGMCHFLLPERCATSTAGLQTKGFYANEVMELFSDSLRETHTRATDYVVKIFGGGNMFAGQKRAPECPPRICTPAELKVCQNVACKNVTAGRNLLSSRGFTVTAESVGGFGCRQINFEVWNGHVWVKRGQPLPLWPGTTA